MSLSNLIHLSGFRALLPVRGDEIVGLSGLVKGKKFKARFDVVEVIDIESSLGSDRREQDVVKFAPPVPQFVMYDTFKAKGKTWKVLKCSDNAGDPLISFWVAQEKTA